LCTGITTATLSTAVKVQAPPLWAL
jgi:hypothetical protein